MVESQKVFIPLLKRKEHRNYKHAFSLLREERGRVKNNKKRARKFLFLLVFLSFFPPFFLGISSLCTLPFFMEFSIFTLVIFPFVSDVLLLFSVVILFSLLNYFVIGRLQHSFYGIFLPSFTVTW